MAMACVHFNFLGNILPLQRSAKAGRCNLLCLRMAVRSRVKLGGLHDNLVEALGSFYDTPAIVHLRIRICFGAV